jgi:hypothetical protein
LFVNLDLLITRRLDDGGGETDVKARQGTKHKNELMLMQGKE